MTRKTNASAAELARRIEQHLPVFARPTLEQLIAAVQRETRAQAAAPHAETVRIVERRRPGILIAPDDFPEFDHD